MSAPKAVVGRIIGRAGETIKQLQRQTGATIQIDQSTDPCRITIAGQAPAPDQAKRMVDDIINGVDPFRPGEGWDAGGFGCAGWGASGWLEGIISGGGALRPGEGWIPSFRGRQGGLCVWLLGVRGC